MNIDIIHSSSSSSCSPPHMTGTFSPGTSPLETLRLQDQIVALPLLCLMFLAQLFL
jgi:hypothetical protein